jgi:hypothetical protein
MTLSFPRRKLLADLRANCNSWLAADAYCGCDEGGWDYNQDDE